MICFRFAYKYQGQVQYKLELPADYPYNWFLRGSKLSCPLDTYLSICCFHVFANCLVFHELYSSPLTMTPASQLISSPLTMTPVSLFFGSPIAIIPVNQLIDTPVTNDTGESNFWLTRDSDNLSDHYAVTISPRC
jgi:hypothetical protein